MKRTRTAQTTVNTHETVASLITDSSNAIETVLDIPCGNGELAYLLEQSGKTVTGVDLNDALPVDISNYTQANMDESLPFSDGSFDAVVCVDGLEHIRRQYDFIQECRRVLKTGGSLVISTPNISSVRSRWRFLLTGFHNKGKTPLDETAPHPSHHIQLVSFPEIRYLLHSNGFQIDTITSNRIKAVSWLYMPLVPFISLLTRIVFSREKTPPDMKRINTIIRKQMLTFPVLFGETIIIKATATSS